MSNWQLCVGSNVPRKDALPKAMGNATFIDDLSFGHMLFGSILYSTLPHAFIKHIDIKKALEIPGVYKVLTSKDVPGDNLLISGMMDQQVLMTDRVYRIGDAIAVVAAETKEIADKAIQAIQVEYEPLEPIFSAERAIEESAPIIRGESNIMLERHIERGDVEEGFKQSDVIIERTYTSPRLSHMYLEPEGAIAIYQNGELTVHCCLQYAHFARLQLSKVMGLPLSKIRVVLETVGGGFGGKQDYTLICITAMLAYYTGLPVKIVRRRKESTIASTKRHPFTIKAKTGAKKSGELMAVQVFMLGDTGAYGDAGPAVATRAIMHVMGPYNVPNIKAECILAYTNNPTSGSFRGFGAPQAAVCHEGQMNALARELKMDPFELRLLNAHTNGVVLPMGQRLETGVGLVETIITARSKAKELFEAMPFNGEGDK